MNALPTITIFVKANIETLYLISSIFKNLKNSGDRGSIYIIPTKFSESKIINCSFLNLSASRGAAIAINSEENSVFFIENSIFQALSAKTQGGAFYISYATLFIKNCKFADIFSREGGLLFMSQSYANMLFCIFKMTETFDFFWGKYSGTAFTVTFESRLVLEDCEFMRLYPPVDGFSLFKLNEAQFISFNVIFRNNLFLGGGIEAINSTIELIRIKFIDNALIDKENQFYEAVVVIRSDSNLHMNGSIVFNNLLEKSNLFYSDFCLAELYNSYFLLNKAFRGTILLAYGIKNSSLFNIIVGCSFKFNEAIYEGGALFFFESNFSLRNSTFVSCKSRLGMGGAINVQCPQNWVPSLMDVKFTNNSALIGGAMYFNLYRLSLFGDIILDGNSAVLFGKSLFSFPKQLYLVDNQFFHQVGNDFFLENFRSGDILPNFLLKLFCNDNDDFIIPNTFFDYQLEILNPDSSIKKYYMDKFGNFNLSEYYITQKPNSTLILNISCNYIFDPIEIGSPKIFKLKIHFRPCLIGELHRKYPLEICELCPADRFSYNTTDETCRSCPANGGADCSKKMNGIFFINNGYWRNELKSVIIIKCFRLESNCVEGFSAGNSLCFEGHIGARCESCDLEANFWNEKFARNNEYSCVRCSETTHGFLYFLMSFGVFITFLWISLKGLIQFIKLEMNLRQNCMVRMEGKEKELGFYIKILLFYLQIIASISEFDLPLSSYLDQTLNGVGSPLSFSLYSLDCLLSLNLNYLRIPIVFLRVIVNMLLPLLYMGISFLIYIFWNIYSKFKYKAYMKKSLVIFNFLYFQKSLTSQIVRAIACEKIADVFYIKADVSFICNTIDHLKFSYFLFVPSLLFILVVFPLMIAWSLYLNRNNLDNLETRTEYGYLYNEYKVYYWEFLKIYMKALISIFLEFYDSDIIIKGLLILLTIFGYLTILQKTKPYLKKILNKLECMSSIVCFLSILISLLVYKNEYLFMVVIAFIVMIFINTAFLLYLAKNIFFSFLGKLIEKFKYFKRKSNSNILKSKSILKSNRYRKERMEFENNLSAEIDEHVASNIELEEINSSFKIFSINHQRTFKTT